MTRLLVHVEGQTEEAFVNEVLAPHLYDIGYAEVSARLMGDERERDRRGGIRPWSEASRGIINRLRQDPVQVATTMVDYYGLPSVGSRGWPGRTEAGRLPFAEKAACVENSISSNVAELMGDGFDQRRFVPYVMMHEFEAMLFSDCEAFARAMGHAELAGSFQQVRESFTTPEEINDSPESAPSKRILASVPNYQKPLHGVAAASDIGLTVIRRECPHFRQWLARLESLVG